MRNLAIVLAASGILWAPSAVAQEPPAPAPAKPASPPPLPPPADAPAAAPATPSPPPAESPHQPPALIRPMPLPRHAPLVTPAPVAQPAPLAQDAAPAPEQDVPGPLVDHRGEMWRAELGYRGSFVNDAGYEPFSSTHYFTQVSLAASRTLIKEGRYSFAPGIGFDFGSSSASARGDATSLSVLRLSIPLEGRMHFGPWGYAFVRAAPGLAQVSAEIDDASAPGGAPGAMKKTDWMFSTDVSAGYAWLIVPRFDRYERTARLWLQADAGYGWVAGDRLAMVPPGGSQGAGVSGVDLGTLTMQGGFFRLAAAVSF